MKRQLYFCAWVLFILQLIHYSYAGECTKDEIMKMVNAGYSKQQIDEICNETLKNPKCCCEIVYYEANNFEENWTYKETTYVWKEADECRTKKTKTVSPFTPDKKWEQRCTSNSYCGR